MVPKRTPNLLIAIPPIPVPKTMETLGLRGDDTDRGRPGVVLACFNGVGLLFRR